MKAPPPHPALPTESDRALFEAAVAATNGDVTAALPRLANELPPRTFRRLQLAHALSDSTDPAPLVTRLLEVEDVETVRDVATRFGVDQLAELVDAAPADARRTAVSLHRRLFALEPTAVLHRMVRVGEIPAPAPAAEGMAKVLANLPEFDIRTTSIRTALARPEALVGVPIEHIAATTHHLQHLQRVQALTTVPEAVPALLRADLPSAFHVTELPEATFVARFRDELGEDTARAVYSNALDIRVRNEQALMHLREIVGGTGLAAIDADDTGPGRLSRLDRELTELAIPLNLETLFGDQGSCSCGECTSVYSPAAYFVELLQYLRHGRKGDASEPGFAGTPLEKLFARRPDLQCLQLTCANTNTVLPYVDLANEVMESFIVHRAEYHADPHRPRWTTLDVWNVAGETSGELLAEPQHTDDRAYCVLKSAVYPFSLPYHQPIDTIRTLLGHLGTSRAELQDTFRIAHDPGGQALPAAGRATVDALHTQALDRASDAEHLGMTQEEYIIVTREAFWTEAWLERAGNTPLTTEEYQARIGVRPTPSYYGYEGPDALDAMTSTDEGRKIGLTFVKDQLLPRTGLAYTELVDLLETRFVNPRQLHGHAAALLSKLPVPYRRLQALVDREASDPERRFARVVSLLGDVPAPKADPCQPAPAGCCDSRIDWRSWLHCYFDRIGKLIVLESNDGPELSVHGDLHLPDGTERIGRLDADGQIYDADGHRVGVVGSDARISWSGTPIEDRAWVGQGGEPVGDLRNGLVLVRDDAPRAMILEIRATWLPPKDSCDLSKVRLVHLDGSAVDAADYGRIHRFARLWRKLGWTAEELDQALVGSIATAPVAVGQPLQPNRQLRPARFDLFTEDCRDVPGPRRASGGCGGTVSLVECVPPAPRVDITPDALHHLSVIRRLAERTGLSLPRLLALWSDIGTVGERPLYAQLFLTHNLTRLDPVFDADVNGAFLGSPNRIRDHLPVLSAALRLKADDILLLDDVCRLRDALSLATVSALYRHAALARLLQVRVATLPRLIALLGDPFSSPDATLRVLDTWSEVQDAGFTLEQLDYAILDHDRAVRPFAPSLKTMLKVTRTLSTGLDSIDTQHPDVEEAASTTELVRAKAGLWFDAEVVESIVGLLDGTRVYQTYTNPGLTPVIPPALTRRLVYVPTGTLQVTGILGPDELTQALGASGDPQWGPALKRLTAQPRRFFQDKLASLFADTDGKTTAAEAVLLAGDLRSETDPGTAPKKRSYFLKVFLPQLRRRLARRLTADTLSGVVGLPVDVTDLLVAELLRLPGGEAALDTILAVHRSDPATSVWKGYLVPPADGTWTLVVSSLTRPTGISFDGQPLTFVDHSDDVQACWWSEPLALRAGAVYPLTLTGTSADALEWMSPSSARTRVPPSALLADHSTTGNAEVLRLLHRVALVVNTFRLGADELRQFQRPSTDPDAFDWNHLTLGDWRRLRVYTQLRDTLPDARLLDLFRWARSADADDAELPTRIAAATGWDARSIERLIASEHLDLSARAHFDDERELPRLRAALAVVEKTGVEVDRLFDWASPSSRFWACHQVAESIRLAIRARLEADAWEETVRPLFNQIRENQRSALVAYLLQDPDLRAWGVRDADSLFEFLLIDVQMQPCMQTSRIKQAISTVQLFIQRCFLGLEATRGVAQDDLDRDRWSWMSKYRVWEANRKVFLYPENWIDPALRDDKSPLYRELESELLQKDINPRTVSEALQAYVHKLDEVANLKVVGLYQDEPDDVHRGKLYVFARTRAAPYLYFHRVYEKSTRSWLPWDRVGVDIPSYSLEEGGREVDSGTYLTPVAWQGRLLVFFPMISRKTEPASPASTPTVEKMGELNLAAAEPTSHWEIKLCWSERRAGKWTPKRVSHEALRTENLLRIEMFSFIPRWTSTGGLTIQVCSQATDPVVIGAFAFSDNALQLTDDRGQPGDSKTGFHYHPLGVYAQSLLGSFQASGDAPPAISNPPYATYDGARMSITLPNGETQPFNHPFVHSLLSALALGEPKPLNDAYLVRYAAVDLGERDEMYGAADLRFNELSRSYALYNWELGFHAPAHLAGKLVDARQFEQALALYHLIFDPQAAGEPGEARPHWRFPPFKDVHADRELSSLLLGLRPGEANPQITAWRDNPFNPHLVARSRPTAYMKWIVMRYIDTLIAWGDHYFRQNTLETIPYAIQCYVLASHLFGPRPQRIPRRGKVRPETYRSLLDRWDAFGNAMVELELVFPFANQQAAARRGSGGVPLANVFGFATSLYFCIPDNPRLAEIRDTIDDRLFKLRHCQDINGVVRQLPLFEPPIDPALLVQATAQGLSLDSVLDDLDAPMPNYRFPYLVQKALELCAELRALGNTFLATREKRDGDALARLRAQHETAIHQLLLDVRKNHVEEAERALSALVGSRKAVESRMRYYLRLTGEDVSKIPGETSDFDELQSQIDAPGDAGGLKLTVDEKEEMEMSDRAADRMWDIGMIETLAGAFHLLPISQTQAAPWGIGLNISWGLPHLAKQMSAAARGLKVRADDFVHQAHRAGRKANHKRQLWERTQQANAAGYELKNLDRQILTQQIRLAITNQELANQQKQIDNAIEVEEFLKNKYTNDELYGWLESSLRGLYHQVYTLAYETARRAEKVYRFDRGIATTSFIQPGYFEAAHDGLLAGERLYLGIKGLEAAHQATRAWDFEVTKPVSLRQVAPQALLELRETGKCEFELPELLFDLDYPGHYHRRIKTVALTVPCVVGPYVGLNCTLSLLDHRFRTKQTTQGSYAPKTDEDDDRFMTTNIPISAIAASTAHNDSGVFELSFHDERFLPFEGAGAISRWRLELPTAFRQFDYDTISDVVMNLRYTARAGADAHKQAATSWVQSYVKLTDDLGRREGLFALVDLVHDFPNEWYTANHPPAGATERALSLGDIRARLPHLARRGGATGSVVARSVGIVGPLKPSFELETSPTLGRLPAAVAKISPTLGVWWIDLDKEPLANWTLYISDTQTPIQQLWMLVRYTLS